MGSARYAATAFGDSAKTMRTIGETPKSLPDDHDRDPAPDSPLFPLLPSVQISLRCLQLSIGGSGSQPRRRNTRPIGRQTDMGRRNRLHHLSLEDDWRDAEGPTG